MFVVAVEKVVVPVENKDKVKDGGQPTPPPCDPIIIVRDSWLTPKKQECFWPPYKHSDKFNAALSKAEIPGEDWSLIQIKRRLYETGIGLI